MTKRRKELEVAIEKQQRAPADVTKLLGGFVDHFKRLNRGFNRRHGEFPFLYGELQLRYLVATALEKAGSSVFTEQPIQRLVERKKSSARLDFWIELNGTKTVLFVEYKHVLLSYGARNDYPTVGRRWGEAHRQLGGAVAGGPKGYGWLIPPGIRSAHRMMLTTVATYYRPDSSTSDTYIPASECQEWADEIAGALDPIPDWHEFWTLSRKEQIPPSLAKITETNPCVMFFARTDRIPTPSAAERAA
jgi:hypothetical protein